MGGVGSGRHSTYPTTVEDYRAVGIDSLARKGFLRPDYCWTTTWSRNGKATGSISGRSEEGVVVLSYRIRDRPSGAWESVEQRIMLDHTPQHFGGSRAWFRCPSCGRRCGKLYGGKRFYCRSCRAVSYRSQHEGCRNRLLMRAQKMRLRLGGSANMTEPLPERPWRMQRRRYERLRWQALLIEERLWQAERAWLRKLTCRTDL
jgi:hypothetical protein